MWDDMSLVWCISQVEFSSYFCGDVGGGGVRRVSLSYFVCKSLVSFALTRHNLWACVYRELL